MSGKPIIFQILLFICSPHFVGGTRLYLDFTGTDPADSWGVDGGCAPSSHARREGHVAAPGRQDGRDPVGAGLQKSHDHISQRCHVAGDVAAWPCSWDKAVRSWRRGNKI